MSYTTGWFDYTLIIGCYKLLLVKGVLSLYVVLGLTSVLFCTVSGLLVKKKGLTILILHMKDGDEWYFTVRKFDGPVPAYTLLVNYEGFAEGKRTFTCFFHKIQCQGLQCNTPVSFCECSLEVEWTMSAFVTFSLRSHKIPILEVFVFQYSIHRTRTPHPRGILWSSFLTFLPP